MKHILRISLGLVATSLGFLSTGCVMEPLSDSDEGAVPANVKEQGVIIGANDLISVSADGGNIPSKYRGIMNGVGRSVYNGALCTATHVGNGIVVSAGHCFGASASRQNNVSCEGGFVDFGYRNGNSSFRSQCQTILAQQDGESVDYAIYRVSPVPPVAVKVNPNGNPPVGVPLTILSHPGGRSLEWSQTCSVSQTLTREFRYQCDTQGGSSGAAVIRDDTLEIVGLHWGGGGSYNIATQMGETPLRDFMGTNPNPDPPAGGGATVRLAARHSNKCIDVSGGGTANGTNIQQWTCNGSAAQDFRLEETDGGAFRFVNPQSGKCLDVSGSSAANGANVQLWTCNGTSAQSFYFDDVGEGYFGLINANSNKGLDIDGWGTADGTNIVQWEYFAGGNQVFRVENTGCPGVTFYQHTNYGGYSVTLPPGNYDYGAVLAAGIANDDVSSLRVPAGCSTTMFWNSGFSGAQLSKTQDDANLVDDGWNDQLSSVIVQ